MKLNETSATARRIGPIRCVDAAGTPVTVGFGTAGAVEVSVNDGSFVAALGTITVIGSGYVFYDATAADASVAGFITVKLEGICVESTLTEYVEARPQGIVTSTADATMRHVGPLRIVDVDSVELTTVAGITCEVSQNGAGWVAAAGVLSLIESGYADYAATIADVTAVGWLAVRLTGACQEVVSRVDVVADASGSAGETIKPTVTIVSPTPGTTVYPDTPLVFDITDASGFSIIIPMVILDPLKVPEPTHNTEAFEPLYAASTRVAIVGGFRYTLRRKHGWYASPSLLIWAVDASGNIWTGP